MAGDGPVRRFSCFFTTDRSDDDQDGTSRGDYAEGAAVAADGTIVVVGNTYGSWATSLTDTEWSDFAAFKLDADGELLWRWRVHPPSKFFFVPLALGF